MYIMAICQRRRQPHGYRMRCSSSYGVSTSLFASMVLETTVCGATCSFNQTSIAKLAFVARSRLETCRSTHCPVATALQASGPFRRKYMGVGRGTLWRMRSAQTCHVFFSPDTAPNGRRRLLQERTGSRSHLYHPG
jgi:hypothetical protein